MRTTCLSNAFRFRLGRLLLAAACVLGLSAGTGCSRPRMPTMTGEGKLHDMTALRRGMTQNEVERIMGKPMKTVFEEGMQGMDMGVYYWVYPEGRVYFNHDGVFKVVPYSK